MEVTDLMERNNIGWAWWNYKKVGTITGPVSAPSDPIYEKITSYWNGDGPKPSRETSQLGLNRLVENLKLENCEIKKDVIAALLDDNYKNKNLPFNDLLIPGNINLVDYDIGANGIAYFDFDYIDNRPGGGGINVWNNGWAYRNDGVDIQVSTNTQLSKYHVSHTQSGEFLKYTINVLQGGSYDFSIISSSETAGSSVSIFNEENETLIDEAKLPNTQSYDIWTETELGKADLGKGKNVLRLSITRGGSNLKMLKVTSKASTSGMVIFNHKVYPNPTPKSLNIHFDAFSSKKVKVAIFDLQGKEIWSGFKRSKAGENIFEWNALDNKGNKVSNGIYFILIDDGHKVIKEKFTVLR